MPRVEFYVLPDTDTRQRLKVACQLAGKAWRAGLTVFIRGADEADCEALDFSKGDRAFLKNTVEIDKGTSNFF